MKVLVVDDDEASRYLVASLLRGYGHEVVEAVDGRDAIEKARENPVDVVVTDILMPTMDGYALCRAWKDDPELSKAPLLFYTASYTEPADQQFAESLGADGFFVKPQEPEELVAHIEDVLRKHRERTTSVRTAEARDEAEVLRAYNERLVAKLEQKVSELAASNDDLSRALEVLSDEVDVKNTLNEKLSSDIRSRESTEEELRTANETMVTVIEASPLPIVAVDGGWRVTLWNPAAEALFGIPASKALGHDLPFMPEDQRDAFMQRYEPLRNGDVLRLHDEIRFERPDGDTRDFVVSAAALHDGEGHVTGLLGVVRDVTDAKHVEKLKSEFLSMLSDELRTPLTSIIGYGDLLEQMDVRENPALVEQILGKVRERGARMRRLIDDLLEVTQIQAGPLQLSRAQVDPVELAREAAEQAEIAEPHELSFSAAEGIPSITADRQRLKKALLHLLDNAAKYSPEGGTISVAVSHDDGSVRIAVGDQGVGLDPEHVQGLFDRFTQADMSDTRSFGGVGVGLFLARKIVEAHGGRLEVASAPGEGSTFTIVLPASS